MCVIYAHSGHGGARMTPLCCTLYRRRLRARCHIRRIFFFCFGHSKNRSDFRFHFFLFSSFLICSWWRMCATCFCLWYIRVNGFGFVFFVVFCPCWSFSTAELLEPCPVTTDFIIRANTRTKTKATTPTGPKRVFSHNPLL